MNKDTSEEYSFMEGTAFIPVDRLRPFVKNVLLKAKVRRDVAGYVTEGLIQTSVRGVDSHGIRLLPHYLKGVREGRINPDPQYRFTKTSFSTGMLDADHTFGHAAGMEAVKRALELAGEAGTGHVAVFNSTHFGAAAYYGLEIAHHDMIGIVFTNTTAHVKSYAGKHEFFGNNPICFAAPAAGEGPFCLDMATSVTTFNKVKNLVSDGLPIPPGTVADMNGRETINPEAVRTLLPIGGYKGYGLSAAFEILCSFLSGMPYGPNVTKMYGTPMDKKRFLGHFISALRIDCFQDVEQFKERVSTMMNEARCESPLDPSIPVRIAGDPEKETARERMAYGIPLNSNVCKDLARIGKEYGFELFSDEAKE